MDVNQGILGDCWLLAAVASLATCEPLLHRVVPPDQSFTEDYAGVFRFQFWQYGRWVEVCIDDRLPTHNGKLIYMHSDERNEFWSAMLEKAYAKLNGSYEALSGGLTSEAMTDFTGGVVERFNLRDDTPSDLLQRLLKARQRSSLMGCSINASPDEMEARLDNGLIIGHAYSVTDVRLIDIETPRVSGKIPMVRVRNPWGDEHEWMGPWGDKSEEWSFIADEEKEEMGLTFDHDGEFWMAYKDFIAEFQKLEVCFLGPDSVVDGMEEGLASDVNKWEGTLLEGQWTRNVTAGGCRNYRSFYINPQYRIHIDEPDDDDEDGKATIIIGLMQKDRRKMRREGKDNHAIGYAIYQVDGMDNRNLDHRFFQSQQMVAKSSTFINMRENCEHHQLDPGDYAIIPSTFEPNEEAHFILRVFSEKQDDMAELDDATAEGDIEGEALGDDTDDDIAKMENSREKFKEFAGRDGEIDAYELKDILNETFAEDFEFDGFSNDMCRSMVAMRDADLSGKLGYHDFQGLLQDLKLCEKAFKSLDEDRNGYFSSFEFRRVLNSVAATVPELKGLRISNATFNAIVMRYSDKEGHVRFDDFVACYMRLKSLFETFKAKDPEKNGVAEFFMDEFIQMAMYA